MVLAAMLWSAQAYAKPYKSPEGLMWGMGKAALVQVLGEPDSEREVPIGIDGKPSTELFFDGRMYGQPCATLSAELKADRLVSLMCALTTEDVRPAGRRWEDWLARVTEAHGKPAQATRYPYIAPTTMDYRITVGDWVPRARWNFGAGMLTIIVKVSDPD
jgi:hypothetical protein